MQTIRTELEKLKIFIDKRFGSQKAFAKHIGYSQQGVTKAFKAAKLRQGRLSAPFIDHLKGHGISITVELRDSFIDKLIHENPEDFKPLIKPVESGFSVNDFENILQAKQIEINKLKNIISTLTHPELKEPL